MNNLKSRFTLATLGLLFTLGLAACDEQGPAEQLGEEIDESAEEAGDAIEEATD